MKNIVFLLFVTMSLYAQKATVHISVKIENRKSDTLYVGKNDFKKFYVADGNGNFSGDFTGFSGKYYLVNGEDYMDIYLEDGFGLTITADGNDFKKSIAFKGKGAKENILFAKQNANSIATEQSIADGIENLEAFTKSSEERLENFHTALKDKSFSPAFRKFMETELGYDEHNFPTMSRYQFRRQGLKGKLLPAFNFKDTKGMLISNEDVKGKYLLIDIWATWCGPCRKESSYFDELELRYRDRNIAFLGISIDRMQDFGKWKETIATREMAGIQLISDKDFDSDFMNALAVNFVPRFIIVDPNGIIIDADAKKPSDPVLEEQLDKLLNR